MPLLFIEKGEKLFFFFQPKISLYLVIKLSNTVDSRYLEIEGTLKNSSRYPYFDISDL